MRYVTIILILMLLLTGCGKKADKADTMQTPTQDEMLRMASVNLINSYSKALKKELMASLNDGGPEKSIGVCQVQAPVIAAAMSNDAWTIKRVSDKNRNPLNLANQHQMAVLAKFSDTINPLPDYVDEWLEVDSIKTYCYYKPIVTTQLCLTCHGDPAKMDSKVLAAIKEVYPTDKATGYGTDQLRGMFVVEVKWPDGETYLEKLVNDTI